jgi:hypothetical protein
MGVAISLPRAQRAVRRDKAWNEKPLRFQRGLEERMMGLEPTTFCMASGS